MCDRDNISAMKRHPLIQQLERIPDDPSLRRKRQQAVHRFMLANADERFSANFSSIKTADLGLLFHTIDEQYFNGDVSRYLESTYARPITFRLSTRMTMCGGMTTTTRSPRAPRDTRFEIAVATTPLFQTFRTESVAKVGGLECNDRLSALQRIMEHELVHLLEMLIWDDSSCKRKRFRGIVHQVFGHTESNHQLLSPRDVAKRTHGISCGDRVRFDSGGKTHIGTVNRITKRASVLVPDPKGRRYDDGKRYATWYVPVSALHRL